MKTERVNRVLQNLRKNDLSQILISDMYSIYYLTGQWFETGERLLALYLSTDGVKHLFYNGMFTCLPDAEMETTAFSDTQDPITMIAARVDKTSPLGVDKILPARFLIPLMKELGGTPVLNASIYVDEVRAVKDAEEQEAMRVVSAINDKSMGFFKDLLHEGVTERQVANQIQEIYCSNGADGLAFPTTVDFAADAAISHHAFEDTPLNIGDSCLFDVGCRLNRYNADMSRTFFLGEVSKEHEKIYNLVLEAQLAAEAIIKPGVRFSDIDKAARDVITEGGYGKEFNHRLGHFIGLEVHEFGDVSSANTKEAVPGNIFSIEPGIYVPGDIGIRIEDLVLVTENGCEILNHYPKELQIV